MGAYARARCASRARARRSSSSCREVASSSPLAREAGGARLRRRSLADPAGSGMLTPACAPCAADADRGSRRSPGCASSSSLGRVSMYEGAADDDVRRAARGTRCCGTRCCGTRCSTPALGAHCATAGMPPPLPAAVAADAHATWAPRGSSQGAGPGLGTGGADCPTGVCVRATRGAGIGCPRPAPCSVGSARTGRPHGPG